MNRKESIVLAKKDIERNYRNRDGQYFANKYSVSLSFVYTYASALGLSHNQVWENQKADIIKDYVAGKSLKFIGKKYGHFKCNVRKKLQSWGVLTRNQSEAHRVYAIDEKIFERVDSHEKAYWLGFLYADGNVYYGGENDNKRVLQLSLAKRDSGHVRKFKKFLKSTLPFYNDGGCLRFMVNSTKIVADLANLGLLPCKSLTTIFPHDNIVPLQYRNSFILGYFDGDGSISRHKDRWSIQIIGTDSFSEAIREEFVKIGLPKNKLVREKRSGQGKLCSVVYGGILRLSNDPRTQNDRLQRVYDYLYRDSPIWLPRKRKRFEKYLKLIYASNDRK